MMKGPADKKLRKEIKESMKSPINEDLKRFTIPTIILTLALFATTFYFLNNCDNWEVGKYSTLLILACIVNIVIFFLGNFFKKKVIRINSRSAATAINIFAVYIGIEILISILKNCDPNNMIDFFIFLGLVGFFIFISTISLYGHFCAFDKSISLLGEWLPNSCRIFQEFTFERIDSTYQPYLLHYPPKIYWQIGIIKKTCFMEGAVIVVLLISARWIVPLI